MRKTLGGGAWFVEELNAVRKMIDGREHEGIRWYINNQFIPAGEASSFEANEGDYLWLSYLVVHFTRGRCSRLSGFILPSLLSPTRSSFSESEPLQAPLIRQRFPQRVVDLIALIFLLTEMNDSHV